MALGRMNANIIVTVAVVALCLLFHGSIIIAARRPITRSKTYIVGDEEGWTGVINMETWPQGKQFYAGDILVFRYDYQLYNVAVVNQTGHDTCTVNQGAEIYDSGDDRIKLAFGANYFICSTFSDLCPLGMKMAINATARPHH